MLEKAHLSSVLGGLSKTETKLCEKLQIIVFPECRPQFPLKIGQSELSNSKSAHIEGRIANIVLSLAGGSRTHSRENAIQVQEIKGENWIYPDKK